MRFATLTLAACALGIIGILFLQRKLSRLDAKWPGLILPGISFLLSLQSVFGLLFYSSHPQAILQAFFILIQMNIPTAFLIAVSILCRSGSRKKKELERMNIQDLT